jgi:hypothetical protein
MEMVDALPGGLLLSGTLEEELVDFSDRQALSQIVKGPMFSAAMVAVASGFATDGEALDQGGAQAVGPNLQSGKEKALAFAQGEGGFGGLEYPSHMYGEARRTSAGVNKKENALSMRKCFGTA